MDEFTRLPIEEVADIISSTTDFKPNCAVVIIDFLARDSARTAQPAPRFLIRTGKCLSASESLYLQGSQQASLTHGVHGCAYNRRTNWRGTLCVRASFDSVPGGCVPCAKITFRHHTQNGSGACAGSARVCQPRAAGIPAAGGQPAAGRLQLVLPPLAACHAAVITEQPACASSRPWRAPSACRQSCSRRVWHR